MRFPLALHTWTLDTTPLAGVLDVIRRVGWDGIELRRIDFRRAVEAGGRAEDVLDAVGAAGVRVAAVGVELGWMFAENDEWQRLRGVFAESCRWARGLGCATVMSPVDRGRGDVAAAVDRVRAVADVAGAHGVRLALEFNSQAEQFNALAPCRELVRRAAHPACALLLDTYHLQRSGATPAEVTDLTAAEIAYVQFSDVPGQGLEPGATLDRLPPGRGVVDFRGMWAAFASLQYAGYASYEAPNPAAWARPAEDVAREALVAARAITA